MFLERIGLGRIVRRAGHLALTATLANSLASAVISVEMDEGLRLVLGRAG